MAQQTTVTYLDDLDGTKAAETVTFALDGAQYEIDLSAKNAKAIRKAFAEFVDAGRKIKQGSSPVKVARSGAKKSAAPARRADKADLSAIRIWAAENNVTVAARGRLSEDVKAQYAAATGASAAA